jgi:glutaredoxin
MLQVFSADWCSACKKAKEMLEKNNIVYEIRNIETDKSAADTLRRLQLRSIPVIYLDDNNYVVGADLKKILELAKKM